MLHLESDIRNKLFRTDILLDQRYHVEEEAFARGRFATVKKCEDRSTGNKFAAKYVRKRRNPNLTQEILHEVAVLFTCRPCERIVTLHEVFENPSEIILVLELAEGGDLQTTIDSDEIPEECEVVKIMRQILEGLHYLHEQNLAHLDVKPQNIVLMGKLPGCDVKLCDFGISRKIECGAEIREILGTPDYVAPEILNYDPLSLKTDMWSVGVLTYVLLTGCTPFGGNNNQETFCNISQGRIDFPDELFRNISNNAKDFIIRLLQIDPRYSAEFIVDFTTDVPCVFRKRLSVQECFHHPWMKLSALDVFSVEICPEREECYEKKTCGHSPEEDHGSQEGTTVLTDDAAEMRLDLAQHAASFFREKPSGLLAMRSKRASETKGCNESSSDRSSGVFSDFSAEGISDSASEESSLLSWEELVEHEKMDAEFAARPVARKSLCERFEELSSRCQADPSRRMSFKPWVRECSGVIARAHLKRLLSNLREEDLCQRAGPASDQQRVGALGDTVARSVQMLKLHSEVNRCFRTADCPFTPTSNVKRLSRKFTSSESITSSTLDRSPRF